MQTARLSQSFYSHLSGFFSTPFIFAVLFGLAALFASGTVRSQPTLNGVDDIEIRTQVTGPLNAQTIRITATPKSSSGGKISMYTAALVNGVGLFFLDESGVWFPFVDCEKTPIVYFGSSGKSVDIDVVTEPVDLTGLAGTMIAVGFGVNEAPPLACADMLQWQRYTLAHIIGAP